MDYYEIAIKNTSNAGGSVGASARHGRSGQRERAATGVIAMPSAWLNIWSAMQKMTRSVVLNIARKTPQLAWLLA
jgi:hypothetical protein